LRFTGLYSTGKDELEKKKKEKLVEINTFARRPKLHAQPAACKIQIFVFDFANPLLEM